MKIHEAVPVLQVSGLEAAVRFYCDVLGFKEDFRFGDYAGIRSGEAYLHLCAHRTWKRPIGGASVSIFCDEVDQYCAEIRTRGASILLDPTDEPYGMRDFIVSDPDGNLLTFGCSLPVAVKA